MYKVFNFFMTHEIIEKNEYKSLQIIKNNAIDIEKLKSGLEFNHEFGIYIDNKSNEKFCPTCLTNKDKRNHLKKDTSEYGTTYICPVCRERFENEEYRQRLDQANRAENECMDEYINYR